MSGEPVTAAAPRWSLAGKMPSAGDFLRRNLGASTAARIDDWLDGELSRRAADDGDDWADRFAAGSRGRFRLGADVLGAEAAHGVIAPSRDAVGRGYALLVFTSDPVVTGDAGVCVARALEETASADELLAWLGAVAVEAAEIDEEAPASGCGFWASDGDDDAWRPVVGLPRGEAFDRLFDDPPLRRGSPS